MGRGAEGRGRVGCVVFGMGGVTATQVPQLPLPIFCARQTDLKGAIGHD